MENKIETIEYKKGVKINIYIDDVIGDNPNEWEDKSFLVCWHERECWIDNGRIEPKEAKNIFGYIIKADGFEDYKEEAEAVQKEYYIFGVDAYIHSGIVLSMHSEGYQCRWDTSDYIGAFFIHKTEAKNKEEAEKTARGMLKNWNDYLSGNIYGYMIETEDEDGETSEEGGCWGFYGDPKESGLIDSAKGEAEEVFKRLKKEKKENEKKAKTPDIINKTLGELLQDKDETIRRHALGILKRVNK